MEKETFEDVLKYLLPYYSFVVSSAAKGKKIDLKQFIADGIKKGKLEFSSNLKINFAELEKKKGKDWVKMLKKQLVIFSETIQ